MLMYVVKMNSIHFSGTLDEPTYEVGIDDIESAVCAVASVIDADTVGYSCMEKKLKC